jgi:hypothetical protein
MEWWYKDKISYQTKVSFRIFTEPDKTAYVTEKQDLYYMEIEI